MKPLTPTLTIDVFMGEKEQMEKKEERIKRKKQGMGIQPNYSVPSGRLLQSVGVIW